MIIMINLLILKDALPQGGSSLVLHIDSAAKHQLDRLSEEDHSDCVVGVIAPAVPACRDQHALEEHIPICCLELERSTWATNMPMYKRKMMKLPLLGKFLANSSWRSILRQYRSIAWGTKFRKNVITNKILQTFEVLCEKRNDADNGVDENAHTLVTTEFMTSNSPIEKKAAIFFAKFASCSSGKYMIVCISIFWKFAAPCLHLKGDKDVH